jgi:acyl-CoA thioesterase-1
VAAFLAAACAILVGAVAPGGAAGAPVRILAFGDSLIHGYGLPAGETFPEQLEAALRARGFDVRVSNGGNSGDTTAAGRARLDWALAVRPDIVLVGLGANDFLRGLDPAAAYANLDAILARLGADGLPVLLAGMLAPRNLGADYAAEFDAIYPRLAQKHGVPLYPFFLDGVALDPALNQPDGLHPNAAGVRVIVERIAPSLVDLIEALSARRAGQPGDEAGG